MKIKAVGLVQSAIGWQAAEYEIEDGKVTKVTLSEPDMKVFTLDLLYRALDHLVEESNNG